MHIERTVLYVLSSVVLVMLGIVVVLSVDGSPLGLSLGTSIVGGGISAIAFAVIRFFDDGDREKSADDLVGQFGELRGSIGANGIAISSLRDAVVSELASQRRVFDRHPKAEVASGLETSQGHLDVDVVGFTLRPFCRDWLEALALRGNVSLRLVVQDPLGATFRRVCHQESRDLETMLRDVDWVTRAILQLQTGSSVVGKEWLVPNAGFRIELRWFAEFPTVTVIRVGECLYARPRFLREGASQSRTFFERYATVDGAAYDTYRSYIDMIWESARVPTLDECGAIREAE